MYKDLHDRDISEYLETTVQLQKALYGLVESALLWYEHLQATLLRIGYQVSQYDRGLFFKQNSSGKCYVCIHVDDVLICTDSIELRDELTQHLETTYKDINV